MNSKIISPSCVGVMGVSILDVVCHDLNDLAVTFNLSQVDVGLVHCQANGKVSFVAQVLHDLGNQIVLNLSTLIRTTGSTSIGSPLSHLPPFPIS